MFRRVTSELWERRGLRIALCAAGVPVLLFFIANFAFPLPSERLHPRPSTVVLDRQGGLLRAFTAPDQMWRIEAELSEISPFLRQATVAREDRHFYLHPGVDPIAVGRAVLANLRAGQVVQGASTLTMQVARLMEPKPRTLKNKLVETFRALQLELAYSKDEILELYFNLAPYGGNIVGASAAAYLYFNKSPSQLSLGEAALLAALPNSPTLLRPDARPEMARAARDKILRLMARRGVITEPQLREAREEPVTERRYPMPCAAPHLADRLVQKYPQRTRFATTLDPEIQRLAESIVGDHLSPLVPLGITNAALVVIDNQTRELLALVGSADYFDAEHQGQVNGALAPRSPGSTLKPLTYALGFDRGLISPQSLLDDVPVDYGGYRPVNYDEVYNGAVSVEEALVRSLNVPAVNLSARLGEDGIYWLLKQAGLSSLSKPREYYGLSLILGGCEVSLLELSNLYAGLAEGGTFKPCRMLKSETPVEGQVLLSPGACYLVTDILSKLRRPELPAVWEAAVNLPKVAWKTGTSFGRRDAWSIGYTPAFTVGVWVGNLDGHGVPGLVGAEVAGPFLFAMFNALEARGEHRWFVQPRTVGRRQVCSRSGMPLSPYCASARDELYLPGISPSQPCTVHELILVDRATGRRLCSRCREGRQCDERIMERWPPQIATWMERNGYSIDPIPEHLAECPQIAAGEAPIIRSPSAGGEYKIRTGVSPEFQKILLDASVSNQTHTIYWFMDGRLVFRGRPTEKVFITPVRGSHTLVCTDDEGRSTEATLVVR